jgi:hypothetical protein
MSHINGNGETANSLTEVNNSPGFHSPILRFRSICQAAVLIEFHLSVDGDCRFIGQNFSAAPR